jgi:hypothetical protein
VDADDGANRMPPAPAAGVGVAVETILLGWVGPFLTYRAVRARLADPDQPDALARTLAGFDQPDRHPAGLLHSTSWRFEPGAGVLTYAALPDPMPGLGCRIEPDTGIACGTDQYAPSPQHIHLANVAVHACRHLAFLRRCDPLVAAQARRLPELWTLIDEHRPAPAGLLAPPALTSPGGHR